MLEQLHNYFTNHSQLGKPYKGWCTRALIFINMAQIYNSDLFKEVQEGSRIQISREQIPTQLADKIVPVMEVNPKFFRRVNFFGRSSTTTTGTSNITPQSGKRLFITGYSVSVTKDAACDLVQVQLAISPPGQAQFIIEELNMQTLTAGSFLFDRDLSIPIEHSSGSNIQVFKTFTVGTSRITVNIMGYYLENDNA